MPEQVRLRRGQLDDIPALAALERNFPSDRFSRRALRYLLRAGNAAVWVAERHGEVVGAFVMLVRRNSRIARIYSIAVSAQIRGRGLGNALVRHAEAEARRRGRAVMSLEVKSRNQAARALYEGLGYRIVERLPRYYSDNADAVRMRKNLLIPSPRDSGERARERGSSQRPPAPSCTPG